ncbi:uncharacterized protein [Solanum lycopersicum]|uniref:uncharacterized protein n=1 Tax=Solanum lycopersicum TaxID=4081 RepID=UPI003748CB10
MANVGANDNRAPPQDNRVPPLEEVAMADQVPADLAAYQLKDVTQTWYTQWRDNKALRGGPVTWEIFKIDFLNRFFPIKLREPKVEEFINLRQGRMSALDYSLKFTKLSKYAPSLVSNTSAEMSHFLTRLSEDLVEELCSAILHDSMNFSRLMVHSQKVEQSKLKRKNIKAKRAKTYESGSSKGMLEIHDKARFNKKFPNQDPSKFPKDHDDRVSSTKSQKGKKC